MKLLIVSHNYFPSRNARAFRWTALAEHWAANGHQVQVVTAAVPGCDDRETVRGVLVHRVGGKRLETMRARHTVAKASLSSRVLKKVYDLTWKKLYWPDSTALWIRPALRLARELLNANARQVLISVSIPFSSHVIGYFLKRRFPAVRWIMDIGDPFAFMVEAPTNNHTIYGSVNFWAEGKALGRADRVSVTTEGTLKRYRATFPAIDGKVREIPPLVHLPAVTRSPDGGDKTKRLVYLGTMYRNVRGPENLLTLFKKILERSAEPVELHLYGNHTAYDETFNSLPRELHDHIVMHGLVDREEALSAMRSATVLVNIGNDTTYQLPSKLVEYASFAKPIINVVSRQNDSSVAFLKRHPCVLNVIGDQADSDAAADRALSLLRQQAGDGCAVDPEWLARFSLNSIASSYESLIGEAIT